MKRFWETAAAVQEGGAFAIRLDGRPARLPGSAALAVHDSELADAIAAEWQEAGGGRGGDFGPDDLPLTRLAATALDRIAPNPRLAIDALARYAETDLLCYRADTPESLARRQAALWQPWLDRAAGLYGAALRVVTGVMFEPQAPDAVAALHRVLAARTAFELAGLGVLVPATGSLVLGLAIMEGALGARMAADLAFLDQDFQAEKWGLDVDAGKRRHVVAGEIAQAAAFIRLSGRQDKQSFFEKKDQKTFASSCPGVLVPAAAEQR